jgi:uncharacterized membrane protein
MTTVVLSILGLIVGGMVAEEEGLVIGLFIGLAFGMISSLKGRVWQLEQALAKLKDQVEHPIVDQVPLESVTSKEPPSKTSQNTFSSAEVKQADYVSVIEALQFSDTSTTVSDNAFSTKTTETQPSASERDLAEKIFHKVKTFFTTGNVVVKVGAIVLFFGVAFLLKYAAERNILPIELQLMAVIVAGIALLVTGWRLRDTKLDYGLILQGAGVGLLYLTVFAASKFYHVLPVTVTFAIMLLLVVLSGWLAIKQDAKSLAIFGAVGGFLAPVVMSSGGGSHIVLFSYYAVLNIGILGIAWFKSWRFLNLVGFLFTFIVSAAWGYRVYQPEHFASTEFFLILFFVFYLFISISFAFKQAPKQKLYVDGTIVFGLPLVAFALQGELVKPFEYGEAMTALALAAIYLILAKRFWLPEHKGVRLLAESFIALGITFASLAVPLLLDGRWTAAVWSLEGAALVWVGIRQSHIISRGLGLLLAMGAGLVFILANHHHLVDSIPILNSAFIGMALVSLSALLIGYLYGKYQQNCSHFEKKLAITTIMVIWGLFWWFTAGLMEVSQFVSSRYQVNVSLLFIALTTFVQAVVHYKLSWSRISISFILFTPIITLFWLVLLIDYAFSHYGHGPFEYLGYLMWPTALFVHFLVLRRKEQTWPRWVLTTWHALGVVIIASVITWAISAWFNSIEILGYTWKISIIGLVLVIFTEALIRHGQSIKWPVKAYRKAYYSWGLLPIILSLLIWQYAASDQTGEPVPFSYIPILNPLDITQALVFALIAGWLWFISRSEDTRIIAMPTPVIYGVAGVMAFVWINIVIARSVHFFANVSYSNHALMNSSVYQSTTSIVWSVIAVSLMIVASKKVMRIFWFAGAGLLALVVLKLFFIDLADSDSISRIISFLVVGVLMLAIGYFSPLPPKKEMVSQ